MEKTTLKKIIKAVRDLEIKKSKNDSQFEFYSKKKHIIKIIKKPWINENKIINKENYQYLLIR